MDFNIIFVLSPEFFADNRMNYKAGEEKCERTLCSWYASTYVGLGSAALPLPFQLPSQFVYCSFTRKAPQLHPSSIKLTTISQHVHEVFMFLFALRFYFEKCTFISPSLLRFFWCIIPPDAEEQQRRTISEKCRLIGRNCKLHSTRQCREARSNFGRSNWVDRINCSVSVQSATGEIGEQFLC